MKKGPVVVTLSLGLMVSVAFVSTVGAFGGRGGGAAFGGRPGFRQPGFGAGFKGPGFGGFQPGSNSFSPGFNGGYNRSFPGLDGPGPGFRGLPRFGGFASFVPWGAMTGYGFGYAAPTYYPATYYAPEYYAPAYPAPAPYAPPVGGSIAVAPIPPAPSVVSFPGGRYELRGDGVTAPYQWVWVPNPPPLPPPPPTAPPAAPEAAPGRQPPPADEPPARRSQLYRWTDEQGVVHWTNQADAVPAKYRSHAKHGPSS